jgi:hypothetical protein
VLGIEARISHRLSMHSTTELHPQLKLKMTAEGGYPGLARWAVRPIMTVLIRGKQKRRTTT